MAITATGMNTGLDINGIVRAIVDAERTPAMGALDRRESANKSEISALGKLKSALSDFQTAVSDLSNPSFFNTRSATSSDESIFTASAGSAAVNGNYSIEVKQLAQAQKMATDPAAGFASGDDVVGSGSLTIDLGGDAFTINVDGSNNTLAGIRDAINNAADNTGVSASIVNSDAGARLVLTSKETGAANTIGVTVTDDDGNNADMNGLSRLATANLQELVAAEDALVEVDGMAVSSASNTVENAVDGLTLDLVKAAPGEVQNLSVSTDQESIRESVDKFVDAYNKLMDTVDQLGKYGGEDGESGALIGDAMLRSVSMNIRREVTSEVQDAMPEFNTLALAGIEIDRFGKMTVDSARFSEVTSQQPEALTDLFAGTNGLATKLEDMTKEYVQFNGLLDNRISNLNDAQRRIDDQRERVEQRLEATETRLLRQFNSMDRMVGEFNSTGAFLAGQLANLGSMMSRN
ncbi:MAG: flagellar filament capping protein FliD [Halothiobacillaceae bacterium]